MATWEDGPEYAPLQRPADFVVPEVAPLEFAPPAEQPPPLPTARPQFADPPVPVAPLVNLVPDVADPRDPQVPFDVASTLLATDSAWGALQPYAHVSTPVPVGIDPSTPLHSGPIPPGPTGGSPWPPPEQPLGPVGPVGPVEQLGPQSSYPAPGTPDWFGPGPYEPAQPAGPVTIKQVLNVATPGLCIVLGIGALIFVLSPIMLGLALGLSTRVQVAQQAVRRAFILAVGFIGLIAIVTAVNAIGNETGFANWWDLVGKWSLFVCWVMLAVTGGLVYRALRQPAGPGPRPTTWG